MAKPDATWILGLLMVALAGLMGWFIMQPGKPKQATKSEPVPNLVVGRDSHDFGTIMVGAQVSHRYRIRNAGGAVLVIRKISTSCGCTVARVDNTTLAPGKWCTIEAELTVRAGNNSQRVYLDTNDPDQPRMTLNLLSRGVRSVQLEPSGFDFTSLRLGAAKSATVRLSAGDGQPFKITRTELPTMEELEAAVEARPVDPGAEGRSAQWDLTLTLKPVNYRWAEKELALRVETDHPRIVEHQVAAYCTLRFPLQWVEAPAHFLGVARPGESRQAGLILASDDNATFQILEARPLRDEAFRIKTESLDEGRRHRFTLTASVPADAVEGFRATRFLIRTSHPEAAKLEPSFSIHVLAH
jgi:hypothetical protein